MRDALSLDDLLAPAPTSLPAPDGYDSPGHVLIVADEWDEDSHGLTVEHPESCPTEITDDGRTVYDCAVAEHIEAVGLDARFQHRDDDHENCWTRTERLSPGRYPIKIWFKTYPGGPWGPTEYDSGLRIVEPAEVPTGTPVEAAQ